MKGPVVVGGDNLPSLARIGLTDLQNIGDGPVAPLAPPVPAPLDGTRVRLRIIILRAESVLSLSHF